MYGFNHAKAVNPAVVLIFNNLRLYVDFSKPPKMTSLIPSHSALLPQMEKKGELIISKLLWWNLEESNTIVVN